MKNAPADQAGGSVVRPEVETVCFPPRAIARLSRAAQRQEESADAPTVADAARRFRGYGKNSGTNRPAVFIAVTVDKRRRAACGGYSEALSRIRQKQRAGRPAVFIAVTVNPLFSTPSERR